MTPFAPIVLFTYKRLPITKRVVEALQANKESAFSRLIVYSDGPRARTDEEGVSAVRNFIQSIRGFAEVEIIERQENRGLAGSFISGITEVLERFDRAIFLEDDNLVSEYFLRFVNEALDRYENNSRVGCISGYSYPIWPRPAKPYFLRGAECWSMATWRHAWSHFNADGAALLKRIDDEALKSTIERTGFGMYKMLQAQVRGEIDSWAVRWWVSSFLDDMHCLHPHKPLCVSIGYGNDSTHCAEYSPIFLRPEDRACEPVLEFPASVRQSRLATPLLQMMNLRIRLLAVMKAVSVRLFS